MDTLKVFNPFDNSLIAEEEFTSKSQINLWLDEAHQLFKNHDKWLKIYERILILEKFTRLLEEHKEELTELAVKEGGKPYLDSVVELDRAINGVKLAIGYISNQKGVEVPMGSTKSSENRFAFTTKEPIGVVFSISAFNHPVNLAIHQIIPAIAVGCPVLFKPSLSTPLAAKKVVELLYQAGLPEAYCRYILCDNSITEELVSDNRFAYVSFIGAAEVGWMLRSKLSPGCHIALEHGGAAPLILDKTADLQKAIPGIVKGGFYHAGQVCVSVQRVFCHESHIDKLIKELKKQASNLNLGNPLEKSTQVGPIINAKAKEKVLDWIAEAIEDGAELICGGKELNETFIEPTVLLNPSVKSKVSTDEVFGPVVCVYSYSDLDSAIAQANDTKYQFQSSIFAQDINVATSVAKRLNARTVLINDHTAFRVDWMPFGGSQYSGIGTGGIQYSMDEMVNNKLIVINNN